MKVKRATILHKLHKANMMTLVYEPLINRYISW